MIRGLALVAPALAATAALASEAHPLLAKGASAYRSFCAQCHGIDMVNPGTGSFDLRRFPIDDRGRFETSVMDGKGDMPAWGDVLFPEELEALWIYVATRGGKGPFPQEEAAASIPEVPAAELSRDGLLTVCLARNGGAMSGWRHEGGSGFDYRVAEVTAERLGLPLEVQWFESEAEEESDPVRETYALLAKGLCDLVPAVPLYEGAMGAPPAENAALPRWDGMPERDWAEFVPLEPVAISRPYMRAEIGLVTGPDLADRRFDGMDDLVDVELGLQEGTLSGALSVAQAPEATAREAVTFNPGPDFLWKMEGGVFDAALVDVAAFDFHRRQNPVTRLELRDWRHPLGFNIGMASLARREDLLAAVDAALEEMARDGVFERLAETEDVHYAAPREPWVQGRLTRSDILPVR